VVLSSCRSALGESSPGREVTSLASAFNIAGASSVIASHWEVDDQVTSELFQAFYEHLGRGQSRGQALRLARRQIAAKHPHPYYWAAFSLFGNPR
jgi:CHAT domain-containing protein